MGCDIYFYVEVRKDGEWRHHDWEAKYVMNVSENGYRDMNYDRLFDDPLYVGRKYALYAILADVCNGGGWAGVQDENGFNPISEPRGLPADVSAPVKKESDDWLSICHSHSYFTLAELKAYDWQQTVELHVGLTAEEYGVFKKEGKPSSWGGGAYGELARVLSNEEMGRAIESGTTEHAYTLVKWRETYADLCKRFVNETIPALEKLGEPDDVRIVFWFNN